MTIDRPTEGIPDTAVNEASDVLTLPIPCSVNTPIAGPADPRGIDVDHGARRVVVQLEIGLGERQRRIRPMRFARIPNCARPRSGCR